MPIVLQIVTVNHWPSFASPNERSRAYQALAVVTRGTLAIDAELERYGTMEDVALHRGRRYPNKAPGLLPLLVPAAAAATIAHDQELRLRLTLVLGRLLAAGVPYLATALLLAHLTVPRWPYGGRFVTLLWTLATPAFTAALLLFAHALAALLLLAAYALLFTAPSSGRRALLAGAVLAWAVCCEYQLVVAALVLVAVAGRRLWPRGVGAVALGASPVLALLAAYNATCFSSPLVLSSAREATPAFAELAGHGLYGIGVPTPAGVVGLLLSADRGLLVWVPLAALCLLVLSARWSPAPPPGRAALLLAPAVLLLVMAGYPNWHGGWFPGPRYLLAAVPMLMVAVACGAERLLALPWGRALLAGVAVWGVAVVWPITAAFPFPPAGEPFPSLTFAPGLLVDGALFPSWLPAEAAAAVWLLAAAAALGLLLAVVADPGRAVIGTLIAAALLLLASRLPRPAEWPSPLARAVVHDVYARASPHRLERLLAQTTDVDRRRTIEAWIARRAQGR